jgi:hypothetical protein
MPTPAEAELNPDDKVNICHTQVTYMWHSLHRPAACLPMFPNEKKNIYIYRNTRFLTPAPADLGLKLINKG